MLYTNYYIIDTKQSVDINLDGKDGIIVFFTKTDNLTETYQNLDTLSNAAKYCLLIDSSEHIDQQTVELIISFFFLPGYFYYQGSPKMLIQGKNPASNQNARIAIMDEALKQGFEKIDIQFVNENDSAVFCFGSQEMQIADVYLNLLNSTHLSGNGLFIQFENGNEIAVSVALLRATEERFKLDNPVLYESKRNTGYYNEELYRMRALLQSAGNELDNQRSHAAILRSNSMASRLQHYYNNEYENLPVWYKKLGQIIKTISGKRSLRSAFDKNSKKYKA